MYHSIYYNTGLNNNGLYYGSSHNLPNESSFVFRHFKDNGYVIGAFTDEWKMEEMLPLNTSEPFTDFDHFPASIAWDPNLLRQNSMEILEMAGISSMIRRWLYGKNIILSIMNLIYLK